MSSPKNISVKSVDSVGTGNSGASSSNCVDIILKDNHLRNNNITSNHFSRVPNGIGYPRELQLGGIPRRPLTGPAHHNGNSSSSNMNNNNNLSNNAGNDFYLHKKFKKVTATVDAAPPSASNGDSVGHLANILAEPSSSAGGSGVSGSSSSSSSAAGMVYKPKFRIKSDMEGVQTSQQEVEPVPAVQAALPLLSPRERGNSNAASNASETLTQALGVGAKIGNAEDVYIGSSSIMYSSPLLVSSKHVISPSSNSLGGSSSQSKAAEPCRLSKEMRLDRKSLDDRITKIIDENQSLLEWPEQFTKMLKNHTSRGQNPQQRTNHLLSGGSTTELPVSSPPAPSLLSHFQQHHNGLLRHSSSSSEMSTSGGSVELLQTPSHHHSLLNSNGLGTSGPGTEPLNFKQSLNPEIHSYSTTPTDLSFGAHNSGSTVTIVRPSSASSTGSASSSTTSSMVPKKRRRLSPTPSRLCGGEVSELPVNEPTGSKNYFQDVDMTVRVSNCGPSGAKVTIRTNNGTVSGGSVQTVTAAAPTVDLGPVDFTKIISNVSPRTPSKPTNGALFFQGPTSPNTVLPGNKPLSLVSTKNKRDSQNSSPRSPYLHSSSTNEDQKPQKSHRGRPHRKKSVPDSSTATTNNNSSLSSGSSGSSLLRFVPPQVELPSTSNPADSTISEKGRTPLLSLVSDLSAPAALPPLPVATTKTIFTQKKVEGGITLPSTFQGGTVINNNSRELEPTLPKSGSPVSRESTPKSENSNPDKETPFQVVPTPTQNPKRPTFLALKPVNTNSKKTEPGVLPSPETPRVAKPYNQMTINGQAYTYLGFKVSTRSSYTCLFKTQPMFITQETDPKLSMYTNWQPRPRDPNQLQIGISTNDSRVNGRKSPHNILYTSATGKHCDTLTVSSPDSQPPISSPICDSKSFLSGIEKVSASAPESSVATQVTSAINRNTESVYSSSAPIPSSSSKLTQPIKIQVSPESSSGIVPISPPSNASSPVTLVASSNPAVGSGGLMSIAAFSPKAASSAINLSSRESKLPRTSPGVLSSSDTNSMDESSNEFGRRQSILKGQEDDCESNLSSDKPLALTSSRGDGQDELLAQYDSPRVKIMEGGFESNEDYTYVRGRGRGRYVCEACGIRCKKPSMLRKHLKTHTDLRPYTCKLCNFSFKTKGNLTKHQKSKSHHKKCAGLGIHPESSTSLASTGPGFTISDTTDDNESDEDDLDENGDNDMETDSQDEFDADSADGNDNGSESFEKEIAQSLLDLSKATVRLPSGGSASSDYESSNDARRKSRQSLYQFSSMIEDISNSSISSYTTGGDSVPVPETPIDLSVKPTTSKRVLEPELLCSESDSKKMKLEKNGVIKAFGVVKEAEAWEPTADDENRCLNLRRVLNNLGNGNTPEDSEQVLTEIKTEMPDYSSNCDSLPVPEPRQRTESEASTGSATGSTFPTVSTLPTLEAPVVARKHTAPVTPVPAVTIQLAGSSSGPVKLHQPWLSPPDPKEKKEGAEVPPAESNPKPIPAETSSPYRSPEDVDITPQKDSATTSSNSGAPASAIDSVISGITSPNSKLFSGLSAVKPQAEFRQPSGPQALVKDEGKAECNVCGKTFARASQLTLHMNIHYIERPFRCDPCGVSFRTKGHLIKHRRSSSHDCKVYLTEAWGVANEENPRPFKCPDCKIAFRIHGHLAKHLRSKMHIMRMECLGKLPFGIYFEMEKSGINLNEIDTTDCDMSLVSLQNVARKIYGDQWRDRLTVPVEEPPA